MSHPFHQAVAPTPLAASRKHLVCGAGGSRAILANAGALAAFEIAGITEFETLGGISGGSIPPVLKAAGLSCAELLRFAIDVDFSSLVPRHATPISTIIAFLLKDRFEYTRPKKGVLSSDKLGAFIDKKVPVWPKNFWTMAVVAKTQILFTADGVYQYLSNGQKRVISDTPAPVGLAIRASCAVPGIIDSVPYKGRHLFDGALSWDGQCPVGIVTRHFGGQPQDIIACDVGSEKGRFEKFKEKLWMMLCGGHCVEHRGPKSIIPKAVTMLKPNVWSVRSLQFHLTLDQKWQAVMSGFQEAVIELANAGLIEGERLDKALAVCADIKKLQAMAIGN